MTSYSTIPKRKDKLKAYLYFKQTINNSLDYKHARNSKDTTKTLILAAIDNNYIEECAQNLNLCGQTARNHLKQLNPQKLLQINQQTITKMKQKGALSKPLIIAIDWHDEMYYGDPHARDVVGTQHKNGSNHAYRYATVSVLWNSQRLTMAAVPMMRKSKLWHVKYLLKCVFDLGLTVKLVLLDRGYFSTQVIRYLDASKISYIMHIPWHKDPLKAGLDVVYTTTTHKRSAFEQASFRLVTMRQSKRLLVFATNTLFKPRRLKELFRRRWGIETSYRLIGLFLAKTTSRLYRLRLLFFFLAVVLYNLWVLWNFRRRRRVRAYALKNAVRLCLVLSWLPDIEVGG
ncbi:MAG: transposase [Candidatus Bathyarchaeota archaeon]|nr:transposase [Candidatus Bathyarchaeota archaeon]